MALFSAIKYIDYYNFLEFQWTKDIPFGYLIKIYLPPLVIVLINTLLILAIDYSGNFHLIKLILKNIIHIQDVRYQSLQSLFFT